MTDATKLSLLKHLAEKVMGWQSHDPPTPLRGPRPRHSCEVPHFTIIGGKFLSADGEFSDYREWNPLENANDTLELLRRMLDKGWSYSIFAVSSYSSVQQGIAVALREGLRPPKWDYTVPCDPNPPIVGVDASFMVAACKAVARATVSMLFPIPGQATGWEPPAEQERGSG